MGKYISLDAIMAFPIRENHCDKKNANEHFICGIETVMEYIELIPAADVAPVRHGQWLPDMEWFDDDPICGVKGGYHQTGWKCSICERNESQKEPYCNCGAKMDLEE